MLLYIFLKFFNFELEVLLAVDPGTRVHSFVNLTCFRVALMSFFGIGVLFRVQLRCMLDSTLSCLVAEKMEERKIKEIKKLVDFMFVVSLSRALEEMIFS